MTRTHDKAGRPARCVLLLALAATAVGCGHPLERKLGGRWLGDSVENFADGDMARATGWARGMSLEFSGSTITVAIPAEEPRSGRYKIGSVRESDVHLSVSAPNGNKHSMRLRLDTDDAMRWMIDGNRSVVLRRERL
jgi:hypothetical protein